MDTPTDAPATTDGEPLDLAALGGVPLAILQGGDVLVVMVPPSSPNLTTAKAVERFLARRLDPSRFLVVPAVSLAVLAGAGDLKSPEAGE